MARVSWVIAAVMCTAAIGGAQEGVKYVKSQTEPLLSEPNGAKIGSLAMRAPVKQVGESGNWVQVSVTAWVKREALTDDLASIRAPTQTDAGEGFSYSNARVTSGPIGAQIIGEMTNDSGKDYTLANFVISVYDAQGNLLETAAAMMSSFKDGQKKSFQAMLLQTPENAVASFKVQFENGM